MKIYSADDVLDMIHICLHDSRDIALSMWQKQVEKDKAYVERHNPEAMIADFLQEHPGTGLIYINAYEQYRRYGGPEEGGWFYDHEEPVESFRFECLAIHSRLIPDRIIPKIQEMIAKYAFGVPCAIRLETQEGQATSRPQYE